MRRAPFIVVALLASGCGTAGSGKQAHHSDRPRLRLASFAASSISLEQPFYAYGRRSRRVSRIDPVAGIELWGEELPCCFDSGSALPGLDGAALLGSSGLLAVERGGGRARFDGFAAAGGGHVARAAGHPTFAAVDSDAASVRLVRRLAPGVWQDETLPVPPAGAELQADELRLVAALAGDGRTLVLLRPATGALLVYGPVADGAPLGGTPRPCGPYGGDEYRAMAVSGDGAWLWLGDRASRVQAVSLASCGEEAVALEAALEPGEPVTSLDPQADGSLLVALANGMIHALDGSSLRAIGQYGPVCEHADGVVAPSPELLIASCYETESATSGEATVLYSKSYARLVFRAENAFGPLIRLRDEDVAGLAADGATQRLHVLLDSALGVLETTDLTSGAQSRRRGLFLRGLLD